MTNYENVPPANPDNNVRELLYPEQRSAWADIQVLMSQLEEYKKAHTGHYPTTAEGLAALQQPGGPVVPLTDPWGHNYDYRSPGLHNDYDLVSYGADGMAGGTGIDSDISSWAEGSVVGRWYEYTPTSALDVSGFNDLVKYTFSTLGLQSSRPRFEFSLTLATAASKSKPVTDLHQLVDNVRQADPSLIIEGVPPGNGK